MSNQVVIRYRDGEIRCGKASEYPANAGWQDVAGIPACCQDGLKVKYSRNRAERYALDAISNKVIVGEDAPAIVKRNADLFWNQLEVEYDKLNVHHAYRRIRMQ